MNHNQKGASDANQTKQASDQSRGAAGDTIGGYSNADIRATLIFWDYTGGEFQQLPSPRDLDPPTPPNQGDALRGVGDR